LAAAQQSLQEAGLTVLAHSVDVGVAQDAQQFVADVAAHYGRVDVLVNNAGLAPLAPLAELSMETLDHALDVNVRATFVATQAVWPIMSRQKHGTILNISSLAAVDPFPGFSVYGACKAWVDLFTKAIAAEGRTLGICVFALRLGAVDTPLLRSLFPDFPTEQTLTPAEVADFALLATAASFRHASGNAIPVRK
jgi:NAD(P)-dependent dehydrogenase (short-subunit alcohol dehydrogenase family)